MKVKIRTEKIPVLFKTNQKDIRFLTVYIPEKDTLEITLAPGVRGKTKMTILVYELLRTYWKQQADTFEVALDIVKATEHVTDALWKGGYRG